MRLTKSLIMLLITLAAFSLVVACSSDDDEQVDATAAPAATSTPEPTAAPVDEVSTFKIGMLSPETGPIAQYAP
ncbi:MAG: hypothetical protein VB815_02570, partial [Dehalococcoidia bacterium]